MLNNRVCGDDYVILNFIDRGGFGEVYKAQDHLGSLSVVKIIEKKKIGRNEYKILCHLKGVLEVPKAFKFYENKDTCAISMEYMGVSILAPEAEIYFSDLGTLAHFASEAIKIIKNVHSRGVVHNDIKPQQFVINNERKFSLVDFGLSKKYMSKNIHKEQTTEKKIVGSFFMASCNCHKKLSLSRRDDMISLAYMFIYLYTGTLPWEQCKTYSDPLKKWNKAYKMKCKISPEKLCKGMPNEFKVLLKYANTLEFKDMPDYDYFIESFENLRDHLGFSSFFNGKIKNCLSSLDSTKETSLIDDYFLMNPTEEICPPAFKDKRILC